MTTEEDFQNKLDAEPSDWQTRLVLADFLQERNDPRADGYRVLGLLRKYPCGWEWWTWYGARRLPPVKDNSSLGRVWLTAAFRVAKDGQVKNGRFGRRLYADDCAALAFSTLPKNVREQILSLVPELV